MCHVSRVTCHMSHVTFQKLCVTFYLIFFLQSDEVKFLRVCYQWGLSGVVFRIFLLKRVDTQYLLISACRGPFLVNKKELIRIQFQSA